MLRHDQLGRRKSEKAVGARAGWTIQLFTFASGYAGGQAEYLRVPHADVASIKIESDLSDEKVLFLSDIFPTGLYGCGECGDRTRRQRCRVGLRAGCTNG